MLSYSQQQQMARDLHTLATYRRRPGQIVRGVLFAMFVVCPIAGLLIGLASAARKALGW